MKSHDASHKTTFQIERIAFFSDAIFAIAITLMIIEVKAPHFEAQVSADVVINSLFELLPKFIGVLLSFSFISIFWYRHHQLLKYIIDYNSKLIRLNLYLLFSIIFIPFTTAFYSENALSGTNIPIILYNLNYMIASYLCYRLFKYSLNQENALCEHDLPRDKKILLKELSYPVFVFLFVIILSFFSPYFAYVGYVAFGFERLFTGRKK